MGLKKIFYGAPLRRHISSRAPLTGTEKARRYGMNFVSCYDVISLDGKIHDSNRIDFLHRYLLQLKEAVEEGVDIDGYFHWSFTDNFEWPKRLLGKVRIDLYRLSDAKAHSKRQRLVV